jgi:hypothetical protein
MVDTTIHGSSPFTKHSASDNDVDLELVSESESSVKVKQVVLASVLASLSIAIAPVAEFVPRIPGWGIAIFDPVSIFWIISFLIGGIWVGLVSTVAGTMGLFLYDPTAIGPVFKLIATLPMIIVPWYGVRKLRRVVRGETLSNAEETSMNGIEGESLSRPKFYATLMVLAFLLRLAFMVPINIAYGAIALPFLTIDFIISYAIIINCFQSLWDALIPFLIVYPTGIFKTFKMW